jgi:hypothetical protein
MKKQNLLKLALISLAMFVFTGAWAQYPTSINTNYVEVDETIYQTTGIGLTLFVAPDPSYHPDYVAAYVGGASPANAGLNGISQWRWMHTAWDLADNTNLKKDWSLENWVLLLPADLPAVESTKTFFVTERFGAIGCPSGTVRQKTVATVAEPVITVFNGVNVGTLWTSTVANVFEICSDSHADQIAITITETGSSAAMQNYTYGISVSQVQLDGNLDVVATEDVLATATWGKEKNYASMAAGLTPTFDIPAMTLVEVAGVKYPTRYLFTLTANSLASTTTGVSNFRNAGSGEVWYNNLVATTISYTLYPAPVTGPIYHIPNGFAF